MQNTATKIRNKTTKNDVYYTPLPVAKKMIEMCNITPDMKVLDPCFGGGVFYNNLPKCDKKYCEIEMGKDFFDETEKFDLIIGNPPFSLWTKWLEHTMKLTDKFCYIMGVMNLTDTRVKNIIENGFGLTAIHLIKVDWWFGSSFICIFEKNKPSIMTVEPKRIFCDVCNMGRGKCLRGLKGNSVNSCVPVQKIEK